MAAHEILVKAEKSRMIIQEKKDQKNFNRQQIVEGRENVDIHIDQDPEPDPEPEPGQNPDLRYILSERTLLFEFLLNDDNTINRVHDMIAVPRVGPGLPLQDGINLNHYNPVTLPVYWSTNTAELIGNLIRHRTIGLDNVEYANPLFLAIQDAIENGDCVILGRRRSIASFLTNSHTIARREHLPEFGQDLIYLLSDKDPPPAAAVAVGPGHRFEHYYTNGPTRWAPPETYSPGACTVVKTTLTRRADGKTFTLFLFGQTDAFREPGGPIEIKSQLRDRQIGGPEIRLMDWRNGQNAPEYNVKAFFGLVSEFVVGFYDLSPNGDSRLYEIQTIAPDDPALDGWFGSLIELEERMAIAPLGVNIDLEPVQ